MKRFRRLPAPSRITGAELLIIEGGRTATIDAYTAAELCGHPSVYRGAPRRQESDIARKLVVVTPEIQAAHEASA